MYNEENFFSLIASSLPITTIHCKLIRKLYSLKAIENGVAQGEQDERFQVIKRE